jgi:hypothetical protein
MSVQINCRTLGSFNPAGSGATQTVTMYNVALATPAQTFTVNENPFTHFTLSEETAGSTTAVFNVAMNATSMNTALSGWLKGGATNGGSQSVETWILERVRADVNALIALQNVPNALETQVVGGLTFTQFNVDAQGAVDTLITDLAGSQEDRDLIGLQFPASRYPAEFSTVLPYQSGDSLVFQFTITTEFVIGKSVAQDVATLVSGTTEAPPQPTHVANFNISYVDVVHIKAIVPSA